MSAIQKNPRMEMPKLRKAAQGADCRLLLPGVCNYNPETTVLAHRDRAGMGYKQHDIHALNMCSCCHDVFDGRVNSEWSGEELLALFDRAWPGQVEHWVRIGALK